VFADEHVKKGDRLYVEGRIEYDSYERDGVTIPTAEVSVRELVLLSPRRDVEEPALDADD
jgi:single-stranded DNA-binding protein